MNDFLYSDVQTCQALGFQCFDNLSNDDALGMLRSENVIFSYVIVPEHSLPYIHNGTIEGYTDEELQCIDAFLRIHASLAGFPIDGYLIPTEDARPSFRVCDDVYKTGCDSYKFLIPSHVLLP